MPSVGSGPSSGWVTAKLWSIYADSVFLTRLYKHENAFPKWPMINQRLIIRFTYFAPSMSFIIEAGP